MRGVRPWKSIVFRAGMSAAEGLLAVMGGGFLLALAVYRFGLPSGGVLRTASGILWAGASIWAGRRCGMHGRRCGIAEGGLCGVLLWGCRLCGALLLHEMPAHPGFLLLLLAGSGAAGGVIGVNTKLRKAPD